jgi:hypothetical protein
MLDFEHCPFPFLRAAGAAGRRTRGERRPGGMLPAEAASRAAAREQFRHDVTRLWRGLLDAQQGDVAVSMSMRLTVVDRSTAIGILVLRYLVADQGYDTNVIKPLKT